jgi:vitamin B12/bleomycin/antimicrobial peptide transport system ATP-binding/permease protein
MQRFVLGFRTFLSLFLPYFRSEDRVAGRVLLGGVVVLEVLLVYVAVLVNQWNGRFFNALEAHDLATIRTELGFFGLIVLGAIATGAGQYWFGQQLMIRWRRWMTERFVGLWMADARHYRLRFVDKSVDNIHLRIGNDVYVFIQKTYELGSGLIGHVIATTSFAVILWGISASTPLPLFGVDLSFPGYLIVVAILFAMAGTLIAHLIGRPLIPLNFQQQRYEADFRFAMARVTDNAEPVALLHGEPVERAELGRRFGALVRNWKALVVHQTQLTGFIYGYLHVSGVFPTLVMTPAYLIGAIPLGVLMQSVEAFKRVEAAFAFAIHAYARIAEWKAAMDRLAQFEAAMQEVDRPAQPGGAIDRAAAAGSDLTISDLVLARSADERIAIVPDIDLKPADRLLVSGPSGTGKSTLMRALAGIWPLGQGSIVLPQGARVLALPQRPYFPLGTLRQALTYPTPSAAVDDTDVRVAMAETGLAHLSERLDEEGDWSTALSGGEQQRVGFARALIHRPSILLLDEAVSTLEDAEARELYRVIADKLPGAIVISAGRSAARVGQHQRSIELTGSTVAGRTRGPVALAVATA